MADIDKLERVNRELEFQRMDAAQKSDVSATPPDVVSRYRLNRDWKAFPKEFIYHAMGDLRGKHVLDYGCGTGEITTQLALLGAARVTGFDLSADLLEIARKRARLDGVEDRVDLFTGDGEEIALEEESFDIVMVYALLHHTEIAPVLDRVLRALKPGGRAFIMEPVAFSKLLMRARDLMPIPKIVSPDERQLNLDEIRLICSRFRRSDVAYFNVLGRLDRVLQFRPLKGSRVGWMLTRGLRHADRLLFAVPGGWRAAGSVVIVGEK